MCVVSVRVCVVCACVHVVCVCVCVVFSSVYGCGCSEFVPVQNRKKDVNVNFHFSLFSSTSQEAMNLSTTNATTRRMLQP